MKTAVYLHLGSVTQQIMYSVRTYAGCMYLSFIFKSNDIEKPHVV